MGLHIIDLMNFKHMKHSLLLILAVIMSTFLYAQPENIMISSANGPNEPSIYINPKNPALIMAGANTDKYYISQDTGRTWTLDYLSSNYGVMGDPAIIADTAGNFLFFHLSNPATGGHWIDRIVCQIYNPTSQQWTSDSYMGLQAGPDYAQDKQWATSEKTSNYIYTTWTQFDKYGSSDVADSSNIMFSTSTDGGLSWFAARKINETPGDCVDGDNTVEGAVPCMGPQNEIYVSWAGPDGLVFDKSIDGGAMFLDNDIFVNTIPGGWDFDIPGISRCNGLPITDCDVSGGPNNGTIYINWSDQRNGLDDTDIWLVKSTDQGDTWSAPIRVNNDTTQTHQFFTWMDIDQSTGYLYFVFYDRRRFTDIQTDVTLAISKDGGQTFENYKISESPFSPTDQVFFGDYTNISVQDGIVRPIWTRFDLTNYRSIWTALINPDTDLSFGNSTYAKDENNGKVYPNPVSDIVFFSFKMRETARVTLNIIDTKGSKIACIINNENYPIGKYMKDIKTSDYDLKPGVYYFQFISDIKNYSKKFIVSGI